MLTWDAEIGITRGILRVTTQTELENFLLFILSAKSLSSHPLMLAVAAVDYSTHLSKELSGSYHHEIGEIQAQTGHAGALTRDGRPAELRRTWKGGQRPKSVCIIEYLAYFI